MKRRASLFLVVLFLKLPYSIRPLVSAPAITTLTLRKKKTVLRLLSQLPHTAVTPPPPLPPTMHCGRKKKIPPPARSDSEHRDGFVSTPGPQSSTDPVLLF